MTDFKVCQASEGRGCEDDDAVLLRTYTPPRSGVCGQDEDKDHKDENVVDDCTDKGGRAWKISKCVNGRLTYMHVKQAIKILLPREYISRSRQKRHWASKYLPGKEPLNPNHDIFKYCDVALKVVQKGKKKFQIGRVEAIQLTKDGSEITSFQTKSKLPVRIRCSLYNHEGDGRCLRSPGRRYSYHLENKFKHHWYDSPQANTGTTFQVHTSSLTNLEMFPPTAVKRDRRLL